MMWTSGSYWRPRPSSVMSALNIMDRSEGSTIECSRTIAENSRTTLPMRMLLSGTSSYSNTSSFTSAASFASST